MSSRPQPVTQDEAIAALLTRSKREAVPIRKTFLQQGRGRVRTPGPVAELCTHHDERALDLYLLIRAVVSQQPYDVVLPAPAWARMLGLGETQNGRSAVSKALRRLEDRHLIRRERAGNQARIILLDESGNGEPYTRPTTRADARWLKLPHAYWEQRWHLRLGLRGKVMLLIGLSLGNNFRLPADRGPDWYGISADTVQRGLDQLTQNGLLDVDVQWRTEPLSAIGYTQEHRYTLRTPFGPQQEVSKLATVTRLPA